jgi:hypothetical protein
VVWSGIDVQRLEWDINRAGQLGSITYGRRYGCVVSVIATCHINWYVVEERWEHCVWSALPQNRGLFGSFSSWMLPLIELFDK